MERIDESVDSDTRKKIIEGINDALYGMMMIIDGKSGHVSITNIS